MYGVRSTPEANYVTVYSGVYFGLRIAKCWLIVILILELQKEGCVLALFFAI